MPDQHLLVSFHFLRKYEADYRDIEDVGSSKPKNLRIVVVTRWRVKSFYERTNPSFTSLKHLTLGSIMGIRGMCFLPNALGDTRKCSARNAFVATKGLEVS